MRVLATGGTLSRPHSTGRHALHSAQAFFLLGTILDPPTPGALRQSRAVGRTAEGAREAGAFKKGRVRALHSGPSASAIDEPAGSAGPPEPRQPSEPRPDRQGSVRSSEGEVCSDGPSGSRAARTGQPQE